MCGATERESGRSVGWQAACEAGGSVHKVVAGMQC